MIHTDLVILKSIKPNEFITNFHKDRIAENKISVSLSLNADLSNVFLKDDNEHYLTLVFAAFVKGLKDEGKVEQEEVMSLLYSIQYEFKVRNLDEFIKLSEADQATLCSSIIYLDFRAKLSQVLDGIGMSKLRIPLSIHEL